MKALVCAISCTALLSGCAVIDWFRGPREIQTVTVPVEVRVPVPVACVIQWPDKPKASAARDVAPDGPYAKVQALLTELEQTRRYSDRLEAVLKACSELPPQP